MANLYGLDETCRATMESLILHQSMKNKGWNFSDSAKRAYTEEQQHTRHCDKCFEKLIDLAAMARCGVM
jgi:bacterioferritin (cytochrome b1)